MKLSIIIPTLNESKHLDSVLQGVFDKKRKYSAEVIVSESIASTIQCFELCNKYPSVKYLKCPSNGRAKQMNFGAKKASGDVFLFLHADVILPLNYFQEIEKAINEGNEMGFFSYVFDEKLPLLRFNSYFTKWDGFFAGGGDQCQFFLQTTFDQLGGYDEDYSIMEDFQMIRLAKKQNIPIKIINNPATVSARKYESNSWLRVNAVNLYVLLKFKLGSSPEKLKSLYKKLLCHH